MSETIENHACAHRLKDWSPEALERWALVRILIEWDTAVADQRAHRGFVNSIATRNASLHRPLQTMAHLSLRRFGRVVSVSKLATTVTNRRR